MSETAVADAAARGTESNNQNGKTQTLCLEIHEVAEVKLVRRLCRPPSLETHKLQRCEVPWLRCAPFCVSGRYPDLPSTFEFCSAPHLFTHFGKDSRKKKGTRTRNWTCTCARVRDVCPAVRLSVSHIFVRQPSSKRGSKKFFRVHEGTSIWHASGPSR